MGAQHAPGVRIGASGRRLHARGVAKLGIDHCKLLHCAALPVCPLLLLVLPANYMLFCLFAKPTCMVVVRQSSCFQIITSSSALHATARRTTAWWPPRSPCSLPCA